MEILAIIKTFMIMIYSKSQEAGLDPFDSTCRQYWQSRLFQNPRLYVPLFDEPL